MRYLSLFSGIGGFEKGIEQAFEIKNRDCLENECPYPHEKPECIGFSEIDPYAIQTYQKHYPTHKNYGDITKINAEDIPDFDLLVGGFPCQSFSVAGKRRGFEDTRGTLFFDIARILRAKQPRLFLLENVKGLLSHDDGKTFSTIIATLNELGYDSQWQVLNSKNHGVPQNRERVFIVGHLRGTPRPEIFPLGGASEEDTGKGIIIMHKSYNKRFGSTRQVYDEHGISTTLSAAMGMGGGYVPLVQPRQLSRTVRSGGRSSPHGSKQNWDSYLVRGKIRRLTPVECERLQGFPDNWTAGVSDTQRYKCIGNAVTVNVIEAVMERILSALGEIEI